MVVIKKPGMFNEDKQPEVKTDIAKSLSDENIQGNEGTVSDIPVVKKETPIEDQPNGKQPSNGLEPVGSKIRGWEGAMAAKPATRKIRTLKPDSVSWIVHKAIADYVGKAEQEFVPIEINNLLKSEHNLKDSDISSYYFAKKKSGYLDNRELTPEEYEKIKKPIRVWWTTNLFWEAYEATKKRIAEEQAKKSSAMGEVVEEWENTERVEEDVSNHFDES
ncbi:hypothetical protein [Enterococcus raffinosus]|uniref:hypothetical protein n=1 Tax=Enterococcus raffinosus TaxID=71452 RepID=UPI0022E4DAEA|nr:hypothetical protein [Enterococcus raffinosus]